MKHSCGLFVSVEMTLFVVVPIFVPGVEELACHPCPLLQLSLALVKHVLLQKDHLEQVVGTHRNFSLKS